MDFKIVCFFRFCFIRLVSIFGDLFGNSIFFFDGFFIFWICDLFVIVVVGWDRFFGFGFFFRLVRLEFIF